MNLVNMCPDIPDSWKGGMSATAKVLGINRDTLRKYAGFGKYGGGIDWKTSKNGRKQFSGREIKRFWREF